MLIMLIYYIYLYKNFLIFIYIIKRPDAEYIFCVY